MRQEEVLVAPGLEFRVVGRVVAVAGGLERGVEGRRVLLRLGGVEGHRRQVAAAAEPCPRGRDEAGVHVRRRHPRAPHVRHQARCRWRRSADPASAPRDLACGIRGENSPTHGRDVHPHLLEDPAAHDGHGAAAAAGPLPGAALEAPRRHPGMRPPGQGVLQRLEGGAEAVAQGLEPGPGRPGEGVQGGIRQGCGGGRLVGQRRLPSGCGLEVGARPPSLRQRQDSLKVGDRGWRRGRPRARHGGSRARRIATLLSQLYMRRGAAGQCRTPAIARARVGR